MSRTAQTELTVGELISRSAAAGALKKAVLSKPADKTLLRTVLTLRQIGGRVLVQAESFFADNKAKHENIETDNVARFDELCQGFGQVNLLTTAGDCELRSSKSGKRTLLGGGKLAASLASGTVSSAQILQNNRPKAHILSGDEPFLRLLDVSDENGRVKDKKQSKFRQINRFLELLRDCLDALPTEGTLRICDLCCGKSYLSFAVYHYFTRILHRTVSMTGVDLKPDVVEYCNTVARRLDFDGLEFLCEDVGAYQSTSHVHLVISLHACDIATDLVLKKALEWQADVILSTPCCHHELNHKLNNPALSFVSQHSMLRQKLCDAVTDALRLKWLESEGYGVCALELIDPEETPKNIMLRGIRKPHFDRTSQQALKLKQEYAAARAFAVGDAELTVL